MSSEIGEFDNYFDTNSCVFNDCTDSFRHLCTIEVRHMRERENMEINIYLGEREGRVFLLLSFTCASIGEKEEGREGRCPSLCDRNSFCRTRERGRQDFLICLMHACARKGEEEEEEEEKESLHPPYARKERESESDDKNRKKSPPPYAHMRAWGREGEMEEERR